jgi:uncharacterized FAD-dependent dehydrogenase
MSHIIDIVVSPEQASDEALLRAFIKTNVVASFSPEHGMQLLRKSIDARQRTIKINLRLRILLPGEEPEAWFTPRSYGVQEHAATVVIVGAGPAGLFAALKLLENGVRPIVIERGKDVQSRRRDLAKIHKEHEVDPNSNYCFGEGGAGTYSDGKLYTRSTKRGDIHKILETLVEFGASEAILQEAHPHIGTNKLPKIIAAMREKIIEAGGQVLFNTKVVDFITEGTTIKAALLENGSQVPADAFILATGHSARDIFHLFDRKKWDIEFKPFALGVRAEHPQHIIDRAQYKCDERGPYLPPAAYHLVQATPLRSVYSFCMCPGGIIAPCATENGEVVTNGWSPSKRNNPWANSGIVVPVTWNDIPEFHQYGALAGIYFQKHVEKTCWEAAGSTQAAPAQRIIDFVQGKKSDSLPSCSYQPGLVTSRLDLILPPFISETLRQGFNAFGTKIKDYLHPDAILVAPESRTSSPVRIPRDDNELNHPQLDNLYPCGEGAGYAGGIVSAAIDGEKIAQKIVEKNRQLK